MKKVKYIILILLVLSIIFFGILFWATSFLDYNAPVKTDNIIVEGWLHACELEQIADRLHKIDNLIVVGNIYSGQQVDVAGYFNKYKNGNPGKGRWLYANSTLVINPDLFKIDNKRDSLQIIIKAKGTKADGRFAHFNLIINGRYTGGAFVSSKSVEYIFNIKLDKETVNSINVFFDNDSDYAGEDRNLFVNSIQVNGRLIVTNKFTSLISTEENRFTTGFSSRAGTTINYLKALGIKPGRFVKVRFKFAEENQTLAAAMEFGKWVGKENIVSFNLISAGVHSRRSWVTYKSVLGDSFEMGIISLEPEKYGYDNWWRSAGGIGMMVDEFFSFLYCYFRCG